MPIAGGGTNYTSFPQFVAYSNASLVSVTGDGTTYTVLFDSVAFDSASGYNAATGIYTVPVTGKYYISTQLSLSGITNAHTSGILSIANPPGNNNVQNLSPFACSASGGTLIMQGGLIISLTATNTISITIAVNSGTKVVTVNGNGVYSNGIQSYFGAYLLR